MVVIAISIEEIIAMIVCKLSLNGCYSRDMLNLQLMCFLSFKRRGSTTAGTDTGSTTNVSDLILWKMSSKK